jgi:hypothetical protein
MNCPHCHSPIKPEALFCQECGHELASPPSLSSQASAVSMQPGGIRKERSQGSSCLPILVMGVGIVVILCVLASIGIYIVKGDEIRVALSKLGKSGQTPIVIEVPTDPPSSATQRLPASTSPSATSDLPTTTASGVEATQPPTAVVWPTETPPPQAESFVDDFSSDQGWEMTFTDRYSLGIAEGGIYRMDFWIAGDTEWIITLQPHAFDRPMRDVHIAVTAGGMNAAGAYGLVCRCTDRDNLYGLHVANDGRYWMFKMVAGKGTTLASKSRPEIQGDFHRIEMWCGGDTIKAIVDGITLEVIQDGSLSEGNAGLFAQPLGGGLEGAWSFYAYFDDFSMEVLP